MMSKQKSKLVSYCGNGIILEGAPTIPATTIPLTGSNSTSSIEKTPHPMVCYKTHALIGAFYILGPGGWILLHSSWILVVVLYSKALRRQLPADEELAAVETSRAILVHSPKKPGLSQQISTPFVSAWKHQGLDAKDKSMMHDIELNTGAHLYQHHSIQHGAPFNESSTCNPSPGLGNMFRTMKPWASSEQEQHQSGSLQYIDGRHAQDGHNSEADDDSDDDLELSRKKSRGLGASDGSMSSRADIPADGKGWWIRQIEGKRRGEICPCTLNPIAAQEQSSCWCGQQRRTSHIRVQSTEEAGPSSTSQRPLPTQAALAPTPPLPPPQSPTVLPRHEQPTALTTSFSPWPMSRSRSQSF
ncbi:hypothetical protein BC939DRAFT_467008 [Gamsiella multidivaricata]|uniref:uncharacterized protein n=1 Tax=Gamsiella multidivaricata TaxID=101098 RepID=UPI00221EED07|nr:uncharacterized protein BC939DRAFT_467008 [Gamsiella multidivaricata]KAI7817090.1 hypothetical protein BC939DRAFT_467008 [Gamsiella multidivaricata]